MAERTDELPGAVTARRTFFVLGSAGLFVAALYWGQRIFVPLSLAVLLTLLLAPVVSRLERYGLKRLPAVLVVAGLAFLLIGLAAWAVVAQVTSLLGDLPQHRAEIRAKLAEVRGSAKRSPLKTLQELVDEIANGADPTDPGLDGAPIVRVETTQPTILGQFRPVGGQVVGGASVAAVVTLLVVSLLLNREDTRDRLIRLAGRGRLTVTTRALDEAGRRIGGYLLGHAAVNAGFGIAIAGGLTFLGVPYPLLWGTLAGAFRFVPSIGIWLVAPLPAALAFISGTGLLAPISVLGLFLLFDMLAAYVAEPRVCGTSVGLAPVSLLIAVAFWTGLWGVIGLVLATPLTVCLAVLGRHIPQLRFLGLLLGKETALRPAARFYQRLLARDRFEAEAVVKEYLASHSIEDLFDRVLIPVLLLVRQGRKSGDLHSEDEEFILRTTGEFMDGLQASAVAGSDPKGAEPVLVLGIPAVDRVDEMALTLLCTLQRLSGNGVSVRIGFPAGAAELADQVIAPAAIVVAAIGPGGLTEARYLCRRLRRQHPGVKIIVGRWGRGKAPSKARPKLLSVGADQVAATLRETHSFLSRLGNGQIIALELSKQTV